MRYVVEVEFESEYVPSDLMEELVTAMAVQLESLGDGSFDDFNRGLKYELSSARWSTRDE